MSIDTLLAESTIKFREALTLKETEKLLDYIAENLPGDINTKSDYHTQRHHYAESGDLTRERGTISIGGMIRDLRNHSFDSFLSESSEDTSKICAIRFQTIPGYTLEEHNPKTRQLWKDVKKQVRNYFALRK